jgi:anti-anti-sigma factor
MLKVQAETLGAVTILHFQGRIVNGAATQTLRAAVLAQATAGALVLDLAEVDLIDAGGLGGLLELRELTHSMGIEFRLMNVNRLVQQVLEITRLDTVFKVESFEAAQSANANGKPSAIIKPTPSLVSKLSLEEMNGPRDGDG